MTRTLAACTALVIREANPSMPRWVAEFATPPTWVGSPLQLDGPWLPRMHKTSSDCSAQLAAEGEPKVKGSLGMYKIH